MDLRELLFLKAMKGGGGGYVKATATGNPLTFNTDVAKPLKSLLIPWTPTQSGSGDPSPENVRPISGVSGLTVYHSGADTSNPDTITVTFPALGKNLFDVSSYPFTEGKRISGDDGTLGSNSDFEATVDFIPCADIAGETVTLNKRPGGNLPGIGFYSSASESACISAIRNSNATADTAWTFEIPSNAKYMRFTIHKNSTDIQIEKGSSATAYEPYTNTVYGGSLDLTTGVLTVEWACKKLSEIITGHQTQWSGRFYGTVSDIAQTRFTAEGVMCPCYKSSTTTSNDWIINRDAKNIYLRDTRYETVEALLEAMGDYYVYYVLGTPKTSQLTPTQIISALVGDNVIWTDTNGSNTAVYLKRG